jgi:hypothetical protein
MLSHASQNQTGCAHRGAKLFASRHRRFLGEQNDVVIGGGLMQIKRSKADFVSQYPLGIEPRWSMSRVLEHRHTRQAIRDRLAQGPRNNYLSDWIYGGIDGAVTRRSS